MQTVSDAIERIFRMRVRTSWAVAKFASGSDEMIVLAVALEEGPFTKVLPGFMFAHPSTLPRG